MIYNTLTLANATLAMIEFLYSEDNPDYLLQAYKGFSEDGYTLINQETNISASFAQCASGDSLVVYVMDRWELADGASSATLDTVAEFFGCDDLFSAAKHIMENLESPEL